MLGKLGEKIEDYAVYEVLGKGGFGCVYKARCLLTGCFVAIKMINKQRMHASGMANRVRQEVAIHSKLKHPSILELYTFFEDFEHVYLVLELAENGELQQFLRERNMPFSEYEAALILRRVVDGLLYLHTHQILHRDISLSNLLITKDMNIKIADFGLATELMQPDEKHHTLCGTPNYISPEVASRASHGLPADVWGLGCMLYTLLVGKPPFDTDGVKSTLARVVLSNYSLPTHLSSDVSDLIERLLKKNPTERIKLEEVLSHPFLSRYDLGRAKAYVFNSVNQKFPSAADSGMGTISSNSGSKSDLFQVHFSGAAVSNSSCNNRPNENLYHEQFASSNYRYREKQHGAGSIESSYQFVPEPHISLLQKFNSMELVEKYNINPKHIAGRDGCVPLLSSSKSATDATENRTGAQITNTPNSFEHHAFTTPRSSKAPETHYYMLQKATAATSIVQTQDSLSRHQNNNTPVALKDPSGANVRLPARFDTLRLLPTRNRTKYVILSIVAESGEVVLEFLKPRGRNQEDRVVDVCRISGDGLRFMLYQPDGSRGVAIKNEPPDLPSRGVDQIYNYEEIPEKHWKKYMYAARFVNMVKAKTPKITLYSEKAKCQLMETMRDYEVMFYDDTKIVQSSANDEIKMVDANGKAYRGLASISAMDAAKLDHFQETHDHCLRIEKLLSTVSHGGKTFPVIIGRRPAGSDSSTPGKKDMSNHRFYSLNVRTT
ncbi:serine/threonine-protein kinase PLK4 isoform X2 [Anopheles stephensi]|uniref:serine/threonine-protein kinase PLK4 isoform X2 n=1 Tax=Anopheles stephensi TaxID=30069 RepID=UPI00165890E7|nr:serine/threonine-protein kinase PLK4 isoform X2 [Anopheles stephensi]